MSATRCFQCGRKLERASTGAQRGQIVFRERDYHGTTVRMHVICAKRYDENPNYSREGYGASLVMKAFRTPSETTHSANED
jgi:hypothetical protein